MIRRAAILAAAGVLLLFAADAWADADADAVAGVAAPSTMDELESWMLESPSAGVVALVTRFVPALLGLVLLVLVWRRWDRVRTGLAEPPVRRAPTQPLSPQGTLFSVACIWIGGQLMVAAALQKWPHLGDSIVVKLLLSQATLLPLAVIVWFRRRQAGAEATSPPRPGWVGGLWTFCVASAFVIPAAILSTYVLKALGRPLLLQEAVRQLIAAAETAVPWIVAGLSVVVAPLLEETVFRGLLYPALRGTNASRGRAVLAAVCVSLLFALVHDTEAGWLPLFVLAMVLTWVFERTNSLATVIFAHAAWNLASLLPLLTRISE